MAESFAELLEESLATQQIKQGAILTGTVIEVNSDVVIVNAGLKSEAVIPANQFLDEQGELEVAVGDEVEVALDAVEDGFGETRLSREKAKRARTWRVLEEAFEEGSVITGVISGRVRGGFTVDIDFVRAFLPGSLVDVRPVRDPGALEGPPRAVGHRHQDDLVQGCEHRRGSRHDQRGRAGGADLRRLGDGLADPQ